MIRQLEDSDYTGLCNDLLQTKGSDMQHEFVEQLGNSKQFCVWFRERVSSTTGDEVSISHEQFTEGEYKKPPPDTEKRIHDYWKDVTPAVACKKTFWGEVTLKYIEEGIIESHFLLDNSNIARNGAQFDNEQKRVDSCVRTAIRRFSGLPERGNRSVYTDCPLGRAWWRVYLCKEVSKNTSAQEEQVLKVFRVSKEYWENIVMLMVSQNSVLGDRNAWDTLVWSLAEKLDTDENSEAFNSKSLPVLRRALGVRAAWQEFGALNKEEMKTLIDNEINYRWPCENCRKSNANE